MFVHVSTLPVPRREDVYRIHSHERREMISAYDAVSELVFLFK
jgi:hypothetical protein